VRSPPCGSGRVRFVTARRTSKPGSPGARRHALVARSPERSWPVRLLASYADSVPGRTQAVYYRDNAGREPVNAFLDELALSNPQAAAKIDDYVEQYLNGNDGSAPPPEHPISSQVDGELRELRVRFAKTRYRILYRRSGLLVVLLHIFEKNTDKLSARDRELAVRRWVDFKARMGAEPRRPPRAAGRDAPPRSREL
jgi:phage-related protein